jgi:hypothetical protein
MYVSGSSLVDGSPARLFLCSPVRDPGGVVVQNQSLCFAYHLLVETSPWFPPLEVRSTCGLQLLHVPWYPVLKNKSVHWSLEDHFLCISFVSFAVIHVVASFDKQLRSQVLLLDNLLVGIRWFSCLRLWWVTDTCFVAIGSSLPYRVIFWQVLSCWLLSL